VCSLSLEYVLLFFKKKSKEMMRNAELREFVSDQPGWQLVVI